MISEVQTRRLRVPEGIESGMRLRVPGGGHAGDPGAPPGDLNVSSERGLVQGDFYFDISVTTATWALRG